MPTISELVKINLENQPQWSDEFIAFLKENCKVENNIIEGKFAEVQDGMAGLAIDFTTGGACIVWVPEVTLSEDVDYTIEDTINSMATTLSRAHLQFEQRKGDLVTIDLDKLKNTKWDKQLVKALKNMFGTNTLTGLVIGVVEGDVLIEFETPKGEYITLVINKKDTELYTKEPEVTEIPSEEEAVGKIYKILNVLEQVATVEPEVEQGIVIEPGQSHRINKVPDFREIVLDTKLIYKDGRIEIEELSEQHDPEYKKAHIEKGGFIIFSRDVTSGTNKFWKNILNKLISDKTLLQVVKSAGATGATIGRGLKGLYTDNAGNIVNEKSYMMFVSGVPSSALDKIANSLVNILNQESVLVMDLNKNEMYFLYYAQPKVDPFAKY